MGTIGTICPNCGSGPVVHITGKIDRLLCCHCGAHLVKKEKS